MSHWLHAGHIQAQHPPTLAWNICVHQCVMHINHHSRPVMARMHACVDYLRTRKYSTRLGQSFFSGIGLLERDRGKQKRIGGI